MIFKEYERAAAGFRGWVENAEGTLIGFMKTTGEVTFAW